MHTGHRAPPYPEALAGPGGHDLDDPVAVVGRVDRDAAGECAVALDQPRHAGLELPLEPSCGPIGIPATDPHQGVVHGRELERVIEVGMGTGRVTRLRAFVLAFILTALATWVVRTAVLQALREAL